MTHTELTKRIAQADVTQLESRQHFKNTSSSSSANAERYHMLCWHTVWTC